MFCKNAKTARIPQHVHLVSCSHEQKTKAEVVVHMVILAETQTLRRDNSPMEASLQQCNSSDDEGDDEGHQIRLPPVDTRAAKGGGMQASQDGPCLVGSHR